MTNLGAGRLEADIGDRLTLGFTLVNSHNSKGSRDSFDGNPLKGFLTQEQTARRPNLIVVQLSDDSPEDNEGGAVLIAHDVEFRLKIPREVISGDGAVTVMKDTLVTGSSVGFRPLIEGGLLRRGLRTADGPGKIVMRYYLGPAPELAQEDQLRTLAPLLERPLLLDRFQAEEVVAGIEEVRFRMVLANDYRIEMSSDHQTNLDGVPQFRLVTRARRQHQGPGQPARGGVQLRAADRPADQRLHRRTEGLPRHRPLRRAQRQHAVPEVPDAEPENQESVLRHRRGEQGPRFHGQRLLEEGPLVPVRRRVRHGRLPMPPRCCRWTVRDCRTSRRRRRGCSTTSSTTTTTTTATRISCATCRDRWCRSAPRRSGTSSSAASPTRGVSRVRRERRFHIGLQPEQQPGAPQLLPRLRRTFVRHRLRPPAVPVRNRPQQQRLAGALRERRRAGPPVQEGPLGLQSLRHPRDGSRGKGAGSAGCARRCASPSGGTTPTTG